MHLRTPLILLAAFIVAACFTYYAASDCMRYRDICFAPGPAATMAPYRYRLVEPFIMRPFSDTQDYTVMAAIVYQALMNAVIFPALFVWLRRSLSEDRALMGLMIYGLVNISAYHLWFIGLNIFIEMVCLTLTLALIERQWWVLLPIIVVASLNRETTIYLAVIYTVWHWNDEKRRGGFILLATWAVITAGLHLVLGSAEHVNGSFLGMFLYNAGNWPDALMANIIISPIYWLTWRGFKGAEARYKRLAVLGLLYLLTSWVGGNVGESHRYLLPVLPALLPVMLNPPLSTPHAAQSPPVEAR